MRCSSRRRLQLALVVVMVSISDAASAMPALVEQLAGRWSGWGSVTLSGGQTESVKCVATYTASKDSDGLEQVLRCASASYRIDATTQLVFDGTAVTGFWNERANATNGRISGQATAAGFNLAIDGQTFSANVVLTASACRHAIAILPQGLAASRISIRFERC